MCVRMQTHAAQTFVCGSQTNIQIVQCKTPHIYSYNIKHIELSGAIEEKILRIYLEFPVAEEKLKVHIYLNLPHFDETHLCTIYMYEEHIAETFCRWKILN